METDTRPWHLRNSFNGSGRSARTTSHRVYDGQAMSVCGRDAINWTRNEDRGPPECGTCRAILTKRGEEMP